MFETPVNSMPSRLLASVVPAVEWFNATTAAKAPIAITKISTGIIQMGAFKFPFITCLSPIS